MQLLKAVYAAPTKWAPSLPKRVPVGTHWCRSVFGTRGSVLHHRWAVDRPDGDDPDRQGLVPAYRRRCQPICLTPVDQAELTVREHRTVWPHSLACNISRRRCVLSGVQAGGCRIAAQPLATSLT